MRAAGLTTVAAILAAAVGLAATMPTMGLFLPIEQLLLFGALLLLYHADGGYRRYRKRPWMRIAISTVTLFLTMRYLAWRIDDTIPFGYGALDVTFGIALLLAELHGVASGAFGQIINVMPLDRKSPPLPRDTAECPSVDILIPTYNEDPSLVETTVIAATQLLYPAERMRVFILDDGGTDAKCAKPGNAGVEARRRAAALRAIADRYGATYLTRPDNSHAKAGNINHALRSIDGELILILDCDHVPTEDFLARTVGFFCADPNLFLLQTPQNFVTADPIERNLRTFRMMPAENELFYSVMQPGLDFWGASFFCGSAAVLRRSVLDEIGGISGKSITEDAETTIKAMSRGYRTAYYNRPMVSGLQPETFTGFILQRVRWAQGMTQIFLLDNVWLKPGLTIMQRLLFTNLAFYWLFPLARVTLLLMPPLFLFFGLNVAVTSPHELLLYAAPYYCAALINSQYFYGRVRWPFISQVYEAAQAIFLSAGIYAVLRNPTIPTFKVTPKGEVLEHDFVSSLAWPFYWLAGLSIVSIVVGGYRVLTEPHFRGALLFVGVWVFLDALTLLTVIGALAERRQTRQTPRAYRREPVWMRVNAGPWHPTRTRDLSRHGAGVFQPSVKIGIQRGDDVEIFFRAHGLSLMSKVKSSRKIDGGTVVGLRYELKSIDDERLAVRLAFGNSATLVGRVNRRHVGLGTFKALGFLIKIGLVGALRHIAMIRPATRSD